MEVTQAVGVRTRSRAAAAAVAKRRRPLPPSPLRRAANAAAAATASSLGAAGSGSCYLKLRSRMLFMAPPPSIHGHGAELAAGLSRCSSTASSSSRAAQDRSMPCRSDAAAEACGDNIRQGSASSDNSESGHDRDRRETMPSSHQLPAELSDLESEIEEFFVAAEEAEAKRSASKYNFDLTRGVPLDAGRFEWTPAVSFAS